MHENKTANKENAWVIDLSNPDAIHFTRWVGGQRHESYGRVSRAEAAVFAAAISQGFEPPRALCHQDKPAH